MRKMSIALIASVAIVATGAALAATGGPSSEAVAAALTKRLPNTKLTKVDCETIPGFCEVQAGSTLFYTDHSARYLVVGRVYDMETRQDVTAARLLAINPDMLLGGAAMAASSETGNDDMPVASAPRERGAGGTPQKVAVQPQVSLAGLPKGGAIEWGGSGPSVTVFSDFRCGYCKMLHAQLKMMNVRVIERPISVLGTRLLSDAVICSSDRRKALQMAYDGADLPASKKCDTSGLDANEKFARENGFNGTPVIVRSDGAVLHGYRPKEFLETWVKGGAA